MSSTTGPNRPNTVSEWAVDGACAAITAFVVNVVVTVGVFVYAVSRSTTTHLPYFMDVVVDERGGFEASTHHGVVWSFLALTAVALVVARMIRMARR